jgi:hypothetical protein
MNNQTYSLNSLSKKEVAIILESLLFSSSTDVCADWYKENVLLALEVAQKIRKWFPEIILENVYLYENKDSEFHDEHSNEIKKFFPEIIKDLKIEKHIVNDI